MNEPTLVTIMAQAQVFASSWSLVGSPFAADDQIEQANEAKAELRVMIFALIIERDEARARIEVLRQQKPVAWQRRHKAFEPDIWIETNEADAECLRAKEGWEVRPLYAAPGAQADLNLSCKSVQARLATQWGYVRRDDAQNAVPEGWQLVPIEPAAEMLDAAEKLDWSNEDVRGNCCNQWHVMLAAAPKPEGK